MRIDLHLFALPSREVLISCTGPDGMLTTHQTARSAVARTLSSYVPSEIRDRDEGSSVAAMLLTI